MSQLTLNGDTSNYIAVLTPTTITASWSLTLPQAAPASNNSFLTSSTAGVGTWTASTGSGGSVVLSTAPTLTNPTITNYTETYYNIGTVSTTASPDLTNGTVQNLTLTASTTCTVTMPTAAAGKSFILLVRQAASTGNGAVTWSTVKWGTAGTPTVTTTAGKMDIFTFVSDGTNWYGSASQGYTP